MKAIALKTNINYSACIAKVTRALNEVVGEPNGRLVHKSGKIFTVSIENLENTAGYKLKN